MLAEDGTSGAAMSVLVWVLPIAIVLGIAVNAVSTTIMLRGRRRGPQ